MKIEAKIIIEADSREDIDQIIEDIEFRHNLIKQEVEIIEEPDD